MENRGRFFELRLFAGLLFLQRFDFFERHFETQRKFGFERRRVILTERSGFEQLALVEFRDGRPLRDFRVEIRLGEGRLVHFLMPVFAIAIEIDHDVASEFLAEIERGFCNKHDRERVLAVHMKDRHLDHLCDVGRIHGRPRIFRQRGETDLIIHDHVNGAACAVAGQLRHV